MLPSFRTLAFAVLGALAFGPTAQAADGDLPPEPTEGEWIEDTLDDSSLWFASSENLDFVALARELTDYPPGRRWVRVVDGKPAWVIYYVPGEILGFEIDTHHFGARATEFRFAAGTNWRDLTLVEAAYEEIVSFDSKWLRLYRAASALPPGARFLKIEFPPDAEVESARLTEVWLHCRFEPVPAHETSRDAPPPSEGGTVIPPATASPPPPEIPAEEPIAPLVVIGIILEPLPAFIPAVPSIDVDSVHPTFSLPLMVVEPLTLDAEMRALEKVLQPAEPAPVARSTHVVRRRGPRSK